MLRSRCEAIDSAVWKLSPQLAPWSVLGLRAAHVVRIKRAVKCDAGCTMKQKITMAASGNYSFHSYFI